MSIRRLLPALALTLAVVIAAPAAAHRAARAGQTCTTTFTVLHNDKVGGGSLPAGVYRIRTSTLTCAKASSYFKKFLSKYNGPIPHWSTKVYKVGAARYSHTGFGTNFAVKYLHKK